MASRTRVIGLTGAPGAGKSEAIRILKSSGIPTLQTDLLGHQLLNENPFRDKLVSQFGKVIQGPGGKIDRVKLGSVIFKDRSQQGRLNRLTHPEIRRRVRIWAMKLKSKTVPPPLAIVEVPLIFEGGYHRWFDGVLCLSTQRAERLRRLAMRGWSSAEVGRREKMQWPIRKREKYSDWVVRNNMGIPSLREGLAEWLVYLRRENTPARYQKYFGK